MSLLVEDGTGRPDADSYIDLADASNYMEKMGHDAWATATEADRQKALRRATQYIDARYRYKNRPLSADQSLEWPRTGFPWPVKRVLDATCELAVRALVGELYADVLPDERIKSETIGPLTTTYMEPDNGGQVRFAVVDDLLEPLVATGKVTAIRLERS